MCKWRHYYLAIYSGWGLLLKIQRNNADRYFLGQYKFYGEFQPKHSRQVTRQALASPWESGAVLPISLCCEDQEECCAQVAGQLTRALPSNLSSRQLPKVLEVIRTRGQGLGAQK